MRAAIILDGITNTAVACCCSSNHLVKFLSDAQNDRILKVIFFPEATIELQSKAMEDKYVDHETYKKIKKVNLKTLETLIDAHLKKAWFISFQLTENICRGAPLLIKAWKTSMEQIISAQTAPKEGFREILHRNLLKLYLIGVEEDPEFECLLIPQVAQKYQQFVEEIGSLPDDLKPVYLMNVYGSLSTNRLSQILGIPTESIAKAVKQAIEVFTQKSGALRQDKRATKT